MSARQYRQAPALALAITFTFAILAAAERPKLGAKRAAGNGLRAFRRKGLVFLGRLDLPCVYLSTEEQRGGGRGVVQDRRTNVASRYL
jgi:hypothetical protein